MGSIVLGQFLDADYLHQLQVRSVILFYYMDSMTYSSSDDISDLGKSLVWFTLKLMLLQVWV
jgi:hypothetical protein